jgi:hypothetical protein
LSGRRGGTAPPGRAPALSTPGGLLLATALLVAALPVTSAIRDPDFWWHLRTGQLIVAQHGLLATDPYTYTASSHHWVMAEWLTEVLFAALNAAGGLALIVTVLSVVTWLGLVAVVLRARLTRPHPATLALGLLVAVVAGYPVWGPRAQMITFSFTCLALLLAERHLRRGGRAVWGLVPLFLVWSNLHSGFVAGLGFLALVILAEGAAGLLGVPGAAPRERVRTLAWVGAACLAVIVVNPYGPGIYLYPFQTQGSAAQQALILEWQSPNFHDWEVRTFEVMLVSLALMVAANRRITPTDAVLALSATVLSLQSVRHVALFVAAATPVWIRQVELTRLRLAAWRTARRRPGRSWVAPPPRLMRVTSAAMIALLSLLWGVRLAEAAIVRPDSAYYAKDFPVCAAAWLGEATAPGRLRIFNQYGEGGYLASRLSVRGDRVFIFGDAALMGDALLDRYATVESVAPGWSGVIRGAGTDLVLFDRGTPLTTLLEASPRWARVYRDRLSEAFVPTTAAGRALARRLPPPPWVTSVASACAPGRAMSGAVTG